MTLYYVDPAATGEADGSSWTDAWVSIQTALDTATSGDTTYCRGTENPSVTLDVNTNSGTSQARITFVGCNAGGTEDGTYYKIDWGANDVDGLTFDKNFITFRNFEITNTVASSTKWGVTSIGYATSTYISFSNCFFVNRFGRPNRRTIVAPLCVPRTSDNPRFF